MRTAILTLLLLLAHAPAPAAEDDERYFFLIVRGNDDVDRLTRLVSIDNVRGDTVLAYANPPEWKRLLELGWHPVQLPHPGDAGPHLMAPSPAGMADWDRYPTYQGYLAMMQQFARDYPMLCLLDTIGYSIRGRLLLALKISDSVQTREAEPKVFFTSTMHGNETVGYVLLLRLADQLLSLHGRDSSDGGRLTRLVNSTEIWINPLANPDGAYWVSDTTVTGSRRGNANGIDLNRNFPDRISDTNNTTAGRQAETAAFMRFGAKHRFNLSINFHGGAQVVNYPWDNGAPSGTYSASPDDAWYIALSRGYATPNPDMMSGGFTNGITNGCDWYAIFGGRQDWTYHWYGGREVLVELWNTHNPPGSLLPQRWTNNRESFLAFAEFSQKGVRGVVTDMADGRPLRARIDVEGFDGVPVESDSAAGSFHRMLLPGVYTLRVRADGYHPDTLRGIAVRDSGATRVDVALRSRATSTKEPVASVPEVMVLHQNHPNPFNGETMIRFAVRSASRVRLGVFDLLGREVSVPADGPMEGGEHSVRFDASALASGVYMYRLEAGGSVLSRKMVLLR